MFCFCVDLTWNDPTRSCGWLVMGCSTHAATVKDSVINTNLNVSMKANIQLQQQKRYIPHRTVIYVSHNSNQFNVTYVGRV